MNKVIMGQFLTLLRKKKNLSQSELADVFEKENLIVSVNAISSWETGKTIPDIDKLNFLADFYGISVDDILEGEIYKKEDFEQFYHMHQQDYFLKYKYFSREINSNPIYDYITKEGNIIRDKFKHHIKNYIKGSISRRSLDELTFFLKHYFVLREDLSIVAYYDILRQLRDKPMSMEEKWWEAQRYFYPIDLIRLTFNNISDEEYKYKTNQMRMNYSEGWEKDLLLATIQIQDPTFFNPNIGTSKSIERYEKEHGKPYNLEQITKDTIKYLIENGAMINREFLSYQEGEIETTRVIDALEEAHNAIVKPLEVCVADGDDYHFYYVENNIKNRLFVNYNYYLIRPLINLGYDYDEIFEMITKNEDVPSDIYVRAARKKGINIDREIRYIKADVHMDNDVFSICHYWPIFRKEEYDKNLLFKDDIKMFEQELNEGIYVNHKLVYHWIGGMNFAQKENFVFSKKSEMSYKEFLDGRQPKRTKELMKSLDNMSLEEIRKEFFQKGGLENDKRC